MTFWQYVFLGGNSSSSTYIDEEIEFLESLSNTTAVYLTRSILFEQLSEFNETLKQKVYEQTKELQIKVRELEEARRKENDMIDIMGHELRTPATVVKLNIELLKNYINSNPEEYARYVRE
jgi:signal transduction histidine kinase